jgi:helicase SWR1
MDKAVETGDTMDEEMIATVNKLHTLLRPFILRRLKADVEKQLPGKFEHVVYCRLSKRQRFLYDEFMSRASTREALASGGYMGVMNTLMQLRKVCNHPDLFEVRPVRTSFATDRGVLSDFEPMDVLVRKRLLAKHDELDLDEMGFLVTQHEQESGWVARSRSQLNATDKLPYALEPAKRGVRPPRADMRTVDGWAKYRAFKDHAAEVARWHSLRDVNRRRCAGGPIFGRTALEMFTDIPRYLLPESVQTRRQRDWFAEHTPPAAALVQSLPERLASLAPIVDRFAVIPPNAVVRDVAGHALPGLEKIAPELHEPGFDTLHPLSVKLQIAFPDVSLLQYDCGKLQKLAEMLRNLKAEGHRVLIFTQMTRVLDILEIFLSYSGHRYLRLDGSTKIEDRQVLTERFNSDARIFCFIASSRSGGVGINLTGADTVFFYDSDWNPSMDRQCMDRAHRIGQTREVHIYRFVSTHTVEENMLKKANQKRLLDRVVIQDGEFTTDFFGRMDWRDMLDDTMMPENADEDEGSDRIEDVEVEPEDDGDVATAAPRSGKERELALALAQVEDEEDAAAARVAQGEGEMDFADFDDEGKKARREDAAERTEHERTRDRKGGKGKVAAPLVVSAARSARLSHVAADSNTPATQSGPGTPLAEGDDDADGGYGYADDADADADADDYYDEDEPGAIDEYMLRYVEWEWSSYFCNL